jgi:hypothetical protein
LPQSHEKTLPTHPPGIRFKEKRGITLEEHTRIVEREHNPERKAFYRLAWHLGASQSDLASLKGSGDASSLGGI